MKTLIDQSGLVVESDYVSLFHTISVDGQDLIDTDTGAKHLLNPAGAKAVRLLEHSVVLKTWFKKIDTLGISKDGADQIILFLNSIGGLQIRRSFLGHLAAARWKLIQTLHGIRPITLNRRMPTNFVSICKAVGIAMMPLAFCGTITVILAYGASFSGWTVIINTLIFLLTIWFGTALHEYVHVKVIQREQTNGVMLQKGLRVGVLHKPLTDKNEYTSALLGPAAGAVFSLIVCTVLSACFHSNRTILIIGSLTCVMQLMSLLPGYGDGNAVWKRAKKLLA